MVTIEYFRFGYLFIIIFFCSVTASVAALPSPSTSGRLLLLLQSISNHMVSSSSKKAKKKLSYNIGSLVEAEVDIHLSFTVKKTCKNNIVSFFPTNFISCFKFQIIEIKAFELRVKFGSGFQGRIHITEVKLDDIRVDITVTGFLEL